MAISDDEIYDELIRRIKKAELLSSLAFIGSQDDFDHDMKYLLRDYFYDRGSDFKSREVGLSRADFDFLLDRLSHSKRPRLDRLEHNLSEFQRSQIDFGRHFESRLEELRRKFGEISTGLAEISEKHSELSADAHHWLAIQSLGVDTKNVKIFRFVPLRVYLSDTPLNAIEEVSDAVDKLLNDLNFGVSDDFPAVQGSWYKRWFAKTKDAVSQPEVVDRLQRLERSVELRGLSLPQAEVDNKHSEAISRLLNSVENVPAAVFQVGSVLIVKITTENGPVVQCKTLTQRELIQLENNQMILSSPRDILENLERLCQDEALSKHLEKNRPRASLAPRNLGKGAHSEFEAVTLRRVSKKNIAQPEGSSDVDGHHPRLPAPSKEE